MSEMCAQITRERALEILVGIARVEFSLEAIRVHSKMSGFRLTEGEIWSVIAAPVWSFLLFPSINVADSPIKAL